MEEDNTQLTPLPAPITVNPTPTDNAIDIASNDQQTQNSSATPINILPEGLEPELTANGIQDRARLAHYALQGDSPGIVSLENKIQQGGEQQLRESTAFNQRIKQNEAAFSVIKQVTQNRDKPLSPEEEQMVMSIAQSSQEADPNTILERMWSHNYIKELMTAPSKPVLAAMTTAPYQSMGIAGRADDVTATTQVIKSIKQKYDKKYESLPTLAPNGEDKVSAWLTSFIPVYGNYLQHNALKGSEEVNNSILPGKNLAEQRQYLYLLGPERAAKVLEATAATMFQQSPHAAMSYLEAMTGMPEDKQLVDNMMGVADVATVIPGGVLARGVKSSVNAGERIIKSAPLAVTEDFAKANEHILFNPEQIQELLRKGTLEVQRVGTAYTPRRMAPYELRKAADAFPEEGSYTPTLNLQNSPVGFLEAPRGIVDESTPTASGYWSGGQQFKLTEGTKFVAPEEMDKLGQQGTRIFTNKDGELAITRQDETGKWAPTGEVLKTSDEPQQGLVPLNLGPERSSMGSKYYDNYSSLSPVTAVNKRPTTATEPYQMTVGDIQHIRENTPGQMLSPQLDMTAFRKAATDVQIAQKNYDDARIALDDLYKGKADEASIAAQNKAIDQAKDILDTAKETKNKVSAYRTHPVIDRAQQGLRAYLSAGIQALKEIPTGVATETTQDLQGMLTTLGRMPEAIQTGAVRKTVENLAVDPPSTAQVITSLGKDLPDIVRPNPYVPNSSALSREASMRISEELSRNAQLLQEATSGQRVQRITSEDAMRLYTEQAAEVRQKYVGNFQNAVVNQSQVYDPRVNLWYVKTDIGKTDATGWADEYAARNAIIQNYGIDPRDVEVFQQGNSYFGRVWTPVSEENTFKNLTIPANNRTPDYVGSANLLKYGRSAADQLSELQRQGRYTATHVAQRINSVTQKIQNESINLDKEGMERLGQMLKQSELDFDTSGNKGVWYSTSQLESEYLKRYGNLPSEEFTKAYYSYKQLMDHDFEVRKNYIYSHISRWGGETFNFRVPNEEGWTTSPDFVGRVVDKIDNYQLRNRGVLILDDDGKRHVWTNDIKIDPTLSKDIANKIENENYQIIQLWEPLKKPLKDVDGSDIYYVITKTANRRNVDPQSVLTYRGGPHVMYTHPNFIGQPIIATDSKGQAVYSGDQIFRNGGSSEAEARAWAIKYDTARQLMNSGDDAALASFLKDNLPESVDDFKKLFTGPNALDKDRPIAYHSAGNNIFQKNPGMLSEAGYNGQRYDSQYAGIKQYINDLGNPAGVINSGFIQERADQALLVPKDFGFGAPDRFKLDTASTLDPYISLNRSLKQANRVHLMEDLKTLTAESYIKEFGDHIKDASPEAMQRNPLHYLYHGVINEGSPQEIQGQMKMIQSHTKNFIGMRSELGDELNHYEQKLQNALYGGFDVNLVGKKIKVPGLGSEKTAKIIEDHGGILEAIKDPASYARSAAFKTQLGLFNPVQYIQQAISFTQAVAISPKAGAEGVKIASYLHFGGRNALDDVAKLDFYADKIAKSSGWTKDAAKQALIDYRDSGIGIIGHEASQYNSFTDPKIFEGKVGRWLDKSMFFFNKGEGFNRDVGYFTAYKEWMNANPGRKPDQYDLGSILRRAEDMTSNMTRADNSALQNFSITSLPLQFQTFRIRQMELLMGKRLSLAERGRLIASNAALYGIPTAVSSAMLYNFYDDIRQAANDRGINLDDSVLGVLHGGILKYMTYMATGKNLDIPTSLGPGASSWFNSLKDTILGKEGAKTAGELLAGPSGGLVSNAIYATSPVFRWGIGHITGNEYPLTTEDFLRFSSLSTTTDNARMAWQAYNTGKYFSKYGQYVGDMNTWDGLLKAGFGLTPQKYQDALNKQRDIRKIQGDQEKAINEARKELQLANQAMVDGNTASSEEHFKKANYLFTVNDIPNEKRTQTFIQSTKDQSLYERLNNIFYRDPRQSVRDKNLNTIIEQGKQQ